MLPVPRPIPGPLAVRDDEGKWRELMQKVGLSDNLVAAILARQYDTAATFYFSLADQKDAEWIFWELLINVEALEAQTLTNNNWSYSISAGKLRRLWVEAQQLATAEAGEFPPAQRQPAELAWADAPPPKVDGKLWTDLKGTFALNYPGEVLAKDNTPSELYFAKVYEMCLPGNNLKFIPWKQILSMGESEKIRENRGDKQARSELQILTKMLWEEPEEKDMSDTRPSPWRLSQIQEMRRVAFAMAGKCHLASYRTFDKKFLQYFSKSFPLDSSYRGPDMKEAQEADRMLHEEIYRLVNEESWTLDDALHELSTVRGDIQNLLQPRIRAPQRGEQKGQKGKGGSSWTGKGAGPSQGKWERPAPYWGNKGDKGQTGSKGQKGQKGGKGDKGGKNSGKNIVMWNPSWATQTNESPPRPICYRWHTTGCNATTCNFVHGYCPVKDHNGNPCGGNHKAMNCSLQTRNRPSY